MNVNKIYQGDTLETLRTFPDKCIDMVITSPPYYALRDYGVDGQLGMESTFQEYITKLCDIFDEVKRVLKEDGTCWVVIGDSYGGTADKGNYVDPKNPLGRNAQSESLTKNVTPKCLLQIPSRFAIEMTNRGWILRNELIWHKSNAMPSSVKDRFTVDYEKIFFFSKSTKYYFEQQKEPMKTNDINPPRGSKGVIGQLNSGLREQDLVGRSDYTGFNDRYVPPKDLNRNMRCVLPINTQPFSGSHFATFPEKLVETPIKAGTKKGGIVLDIFMGSGTTGVVAKKLGRNYIGIELNEKYVSMAKKRISKVYYQERMFEENAI